MRKIVKLFKESPLINKVAYWICLTLTIGFLIAGFIVPPMGVIDNSVLIAVGELFGFASLATLIAAVERGIDAEVKHKDTEIKIINPDKDK